MNPISEDPGTIQFYTLSGTMTRDWESAFSFWGSAAKQDGRAALRGGVFQARLGPCVPWKPALLHE